MLGLLLRKAIDQSRVSSREEDLLPRLLRMLIIFSYQLSVGLALLSCTHTSYQGQLTFTATLKDNPSSRAPPGVSRHLPLALLCPILLPTHPLDSPVAAPNDYPINFILK